LNAAFGPEGVDVSFAGDESGEQRVRVGAVVDASGRAGFLGARLGFRRPDPRLRKVAVYAHYEGISRPEGRRGGDIRIVSRPDLGWFWFIPLAGGRMSVGVVVDLAVHNARSHASLEETLAAYIEETPQAAALCRSARRVSPVRSEADFSYHSDRHAGDRFLIAGDAGAFLDPVFSTGVMLAMTSGVEAAEAIEAGLAAGDLSARQFRPYERRLHRRYLHFRRFVAGFYEAPFRDVFFQPTARLGLAPAVTSILAGNWRPSWAVRWRVALFFLTVRMQRYLTLVPRTHSGRPRSAAPPLKATAVASGGEVTTATGS
jgi:flavin-dependent dehydrogenase